MTGGSVHHGDTPLTHDDPGCRTNRNAFTLIGPSQMLGCWFGKGTHPDSDEAAVMGVLLPHLVLPRGVGVDRRRACPHRRDVGPWYTAGSNGGLTLLGTMVPARLCVSIAVVQPTLVTPDGRGGLGGGYDPSAFICGFESLR